MISRRDIFKRYYGLILKQKFKFSVSIILLILSTFCVIYAPILVGKIVNSLDIKSTHFLFNIILLIFLYLLGFLLKLPSARFMSFVGEQSIYKLRSDLYHELNIINLDLISSNSAGNIMARVNNDLMNIRNFITSSLSKILVDILVIIIIISIIFTININLALIYLISIPIYILFFYITDIKSKNQYSMHQENIGSLIGIIGDSLVNHLGIKSYNCEDFIERVFSRKVDEVNMYYKSSHIISGLNAPITNILINLTTIGVYTYGLVLLINNEIYLGTLLTIILFGKILNNPLKKISHYLVSFETVMASFKRVIEIMELEEDKPKGNIILNKEDVKGDIEFKNINYKGIIKNFNFKINSGDIVSIVGSSGVGKTTLMELLLGLYKLDSGEIRIDGINIYDTNFKTYRKIFGYVSQDKWIFKDTVANNIKYGGENLNINNVKEICRELNCDKLIEKLPEKYDTVISDEKNNLSEGEREYYTIARALINKPKILILDDINLNITHLFKNKTVFIITNNEDIIKKSDKIIRL